MAGRGTRALEQRIMGLVVFCSCASKETDRMTREKSDTHPDVERLQIEGYRRMSPGRKLMLVFDMIEFARALARSDVKRRHPHAGEREIDLRVASRWLDRDLMVKAFGWDPEKEGY